MKFLETIFDVIEQGLGVTFVIIMFVSVLFQIFFRYALNSPLTWTEEAARYSFIWVVLVGAAFAVRRREHVAMEVLFNRLPKSAQKRLSWSIHLIIFLALVYLLPVSWSFFAFMKNVSAPTLGISWGFLFFAGPLSIALMTVHTLIRLLRDR